LIFDTRYFWVLFTEKDPELIRKLKSIYEKSSKRIVSVITIYEMYKLTLQFEGREVANVRTNSIKKDFKVIEINATIAEEGARIAIRSKMPMTDSLIIGTARMLGEVCVTDDPHFDQIKRVWI